MAYSKTYTFTRPDEDTAMPTLEATNSSAKQASADKMAELNMVKTYEIEGLVTKVIYTSEDKATHLASEQTLADTAGTTAHAGTGVGAAYKQACIDAGITCVVSDSDGVQIDSW